MAAWKTPLITTLIRFAVITPSRRAARSDLPAGDPLHELRARRLHRLLGRDDFDRVDRDEVVVVLVGGDALVEVTHLDVVLPPRPPAGQRLDLEAFEGFHHLRLGRPLA